MGKVVTKKNILFLENILKQLWRSVYYEIFRLLVLPKFMLTKNGLSLVVSGNFLEFLLLFCAKKVV